METFAAVLVGALVAGLLAVVGVGLLGIGLYAGWRSRARWDRELAERAEQWTVEFEPDGEEEEEQDEADYWKRN